MAFQVKIAEERDMVILALEGKMDTASADELSLGLEEVKRRGKKKFEGRKTVEINSRTITGVQVASEGDKIMGVKAITKIIRMNIL